MRNKDKAFDILNEVCNDALPHSQSEDEETSRIEQLEASIMEKLEKRIDEKLESYKQGAVDNVDNDVDSKKEENEDNNGGSENGDN